MNKKIFTMETKGTINIDGMDIPIENEKNILEVIRKADIELPTFCYHSHLRFKEYRKFIRIRKIKSLIKQGLIEINKKKKNKKGTRG